ncbi:MAG: hypothetical protein J7K46_10565 [Bacteroidales bacterium]|nr:hypothetical protein [Bacteroidales bacterium]
MRTSRKTKILLTPFILLTGIIIFLLADNLFLATRYINPCTDEQLPEEDIREAAYIFDLKETAGIWPGFNTTQIPLILFNDKYEFILLQNDHGKDTGPGGNRSKAAEMSITRRLSSGPKAFAVRLNTRWAGSIGTKKQMNREMYLGIRNEMPAVVGHIFPFFMIRISEDIHISGTIHEMFHAYQAVQNEEKFLLSERSYSLLKDYPYRDSIFNEYWDREGKLLYRALETKTRRELYMLADSFLTVRDKRRMFSGLSPEHELTEKRLEWLEGLAKYAEARSYILAAQKNNSGVKFKKKNPYWKREQKQMLSRLGKTDYDNRFYHSGSAMAFLLDILYPEWKNEIMKDSVYPEDLIRRSLQYYSNN